MYAVIETGGKQHKVEKGMILSIDLLKDDVGKKITFDNVLLYVDGDNVEVGQPYLDNVKVTAEVNYLITKLNGIKKTEQLASRYYIKAIESAKKINNLAVRQEMIELTNIALKRKK